MKPRPLSVFVLAGLLSACSPKQQEDQPQSASAGAGTMDRTVLPIKEPKRQTYKELDARNAKAPERFEVKAPKGAPNVVVILIDDIGFGAANHFGGPIDMPVLDNLGKNGLSYNRFHTTALCSPTRMALLTGYNHHSNNAGSIIWKQPLLFQVTTGWDLKALHLWLKYFVKMVSARQPLANITKRHPGKYPYLVH